VLREQQEKYFIALEMFVAFFERKESDRKKRLRNRKFYLKDELALQIGKEFRLKYRYRID